jgi:hypothetical protein
MLALLSYQEYNTFTGHKMIIPATLKMIPAHKNP